MIELHPTIVIDLGGAGLKEITKAFLACLRRVFEELVTQVLYYFAEEYKNSGHLAELLGCQGVTRKSSTGWKRTFIHTIFGKIAVPQIQVQVKETGKKRYITRLLFGIEARQRMPHYTRKMLALIGSLAPFRVGQKLISLLTGAKISAVSILRSVRVIGKEIEFEVDGKQSNVFEGDGTGVPVINSGKLRQGA